MGRNDAPARDPVIRSVQYLRAAAALAVGASHAGGHAGLNWSTGAAGVDVFFVISGFIIWIVTSRRAVTPVRFTLDRMIRIAPPYIVLTVAVALLAVLVPAAFPNMHLTVAHLLASVLFLPHIDPYGTMFPVVVPGWTLTYEVFFYGVFALALTRPRHARLRAAVLPLCLLVAAGYLTGRSNAVLETYTNPLLLEFVAGICLGVAWEHDRLPSARAGMASLILGVAALGVWQAVAGVAPEHARALAWGVPALLITAGGVTIERRGKLGHSRVLRTLGDASYSIYLVNVFVVAAAWRATGSISVPVYVVAALGATVAGGLLFRRAVELPLMRLARAWTRRSGPQAVPGPAAAHHILAG